MTKCTENGSTSQNEVPETENEVPQAENEVPEAENEVPEADPFMSNLDRLKLELSQINEGVQSYVYGAENWGPSRYLRDDDEEDRYETGSENFSVFNYTDGEDESQTLLRCQFCDLDFELSGHHSRMEDMNSYDPNNLVCPVCDEKLGEDAINAAWNSINRRKRGWRSEKSSVSPGNKAMIDRKLAAAARGNSHEPMSDSLLSPFASNASVQSLSDIQSDEDTISIASDISNTKSSSGTDAADVGDEQDHQEKSVRVSFVQELLISTLFEEMWP